MGSTWTDWLFDPSGLTPHGFCLLWEPWLIWSHAAADVAVGISYFTIPAALTLFARRRPDLSYGPIFWLFAAFILLCGTGHWLELVTLWVPVYRLETVVKIATAVASVFTAAMLWWLMPKALALPSPAQMRVAHEAVRESAERYRNNFVHSPVPMQILDARGRITKVSDRWLELLGYARDEAIGRHFSDFHDPTARTDVFWGELLGRGDLRDVERRLVRRDGTVLDVLVSGTVERLPGREDFRVICALVDVTERRRAEAALRTSAERLHQAQKMEAIGQLTGGVAHDFNNMLQAVVGNLQLIGNRLRDSRPDITRLADNALEATARAARLTSQLLSFARRQQLDPRPLAPIEVVKGLQGLLARTLGERIGLRVEAEEEAGLCLADRNQLESALLNLVINARDAIDGGAGTVTISIRPERLETPIGGWPPAGDYVRIAVADDGPGMPPEIRCRAFEPFFTTKGSGKGTGLGLAQIHGFAHQSGGTATIESAPGQGAEIAILLPRAGASDAPIPSIGEDDAVEQAGVTCGAGETVLVVEDEAAVRETLLELLDELGYRTIEATNADSGLAALQSGAAVDVVVTDLAMPGSIDGLEFADVVRESHPDLPIVLTTGNPDLLHGARLPAHVTFIQKPYYRSRIAAALRQALHTKAEIGGR